MLSGVHGVELILSAVDSMKCRNRQLSNECKIVPVSNSKCTPHTLLDDRVEN